MATVSTQVASSIASLTLDMLISQTLSPGDCSTGDDTLDFSFTPGSNTPLVHGPTSPFSPGPRSG
ncbi:hypothetical protein CH063_14481 [Colletotrichum higginsianum]|uniref:Uncharacterized protein n=1 Tax=Colletotrichum higginsianum (strain IMI 349063) TaxID=759273 RepID=H1VYR7_COLHI|nr:hypothetical protein CH063_14481 [Colletotrichum higginsianum]